MGNVFHVLKFDLKNLNQGPMIKKMGFFLGTPVIATQQNLLTAEFFYFRHMFVLSKMRAD